MPGVTTTFTRAYYTCRCTEVVRRHVHGADPQMRLMSSITLWAHCRHSICGHTGNMLCGHSICCVCKGSPHYRCSQLWALQTLVYTTTYLWWRRISDKKPTYNPYLLLFLLAAFAVIVRPCGWFIQSINSSKSTSPSAFFAEISSSNCSLTAGSVHLPPSCITFHI
eukprot:COSAG02_NODE_5615_length_4180_cov_112.024772_2_plen_166_part_00